MSVKLRQRLERTIARRVVLDALAAGYTLSVNNGGDEDEIPPQSKARPVLSAMFATDCEHLKMWKTGAAGTVCVGWVFFVYGNDGWDVVNDYTTNLDPIMAGADRLAELYQ